MSQYHLIKLYLPELKVFGTDTKDRPFYSASDLEAALQKGVTVFGQKEMNHEGLGSRQLPSDTHIGLLLGYQPIPQEKPVSKIELIGVIQNGCSDEHKASLIERIKKTEVIK